MHVREFRCEMGPPPPAELFPFIADAGNLDAVTPLWLPLASPRRAPSRCSPPC